MTIIVTVKDKMPLIVPAIIVKKAGFKNGEELEFRASSGIITISPKLTPTKRRHGIT